jgi:hypothetical protein
MIKFKFLTIIFLILEITSLKAQEAMTKDTLLQFKRFHDYGISINATRVNTNYTEFVTDKGKYSFDKNKYLPTFDFGMNYGWYIKYKEAGDFLSVKTGIKCTSRNADLKDSIMNNLRFWTGYIQVPVQFGFRIPLKPNMIKNNRFRSLEINAGFYAAVLSSERLDSKDNVDASWTSSFGNNIRFGSLAEIAFIAYSDNGQGHKFGLRISRDYNSIYKFKNTKNQLYPYFITNGIFYDITFNHK